MQRGFECQRNVWQTKRLGYQGINPATDFQTLKAWKRIKILIIAKDKERS
jgi:hypothetical protein